LVFDRSVSEQKMNVISMKLEIFFNSQSKSIELEHNKPVSYTIGRNDENTIVIPLAQVSKQHAIIEWTDSNELYIKDLNSTNGTFVNGVQIGANIPVKINETDSISFVNAELIRIKITDESTLVEPIPEPSISKPKSEQNSNSLSELFNKKSQIVIGRIEDCDYVISNPSISRRHAMVEKIGPNSYKITDLNSLNGTYVNGRRITGSETISNADQILIGRFLIYIEGTIKDLSKEAAIKAERIIKKYSSGYVGLHETSIEIPAKSLLAVMGPSGCGKSTLLKALNGDSPASSGRVTICGLELNENYDYIKTHIGYVPQDDIVHRELSVYKSLYYAAKLRLIHATEEEIEQKIQEVLEALNITHIKDNLVSGISGGQRKRVSIAVEILTDPLILFLDEPTSPLDPQTIEEFLSCAKRLAEKGTTIIMVTHKPEDLVYMDSVIFMAEGGHLVYYGDTTTYLAHFKQDRLTQVYAELVKDKAGPWIELYKKQNPNDDTQHLPPQKIKKTERINYFSQFWWLTMRYFNIKLNDKLNTLLMVGQAPIIALLIVMIFNRIELSVLFLMAISAIWFGANNAAREIVGEASVYKRERMYNQSILAYIFSKITVLGTFAFLQCIIFVSVLYFAYSGGEKVAFNNPLYAVIWMFILSLTSTLMGLLLSALANSTEKVMTLIPISLIPQILLAGVLSKITTPFGELLSYIVIARWGTEGFTNIQYDVEIMKQVPDPKTGELVSSKLSNGETEYVSLDASDMLNKNFHSTYDDIFGSLHGTPHLDLAAVGVIALIFLIGIYIALKKKDSIRIG
jgi:ABC-type multidrug transport system ATPase subunit/pSer/pThr/pTyr-binding forkhead associated (FHA) protein/ABC-type multidrug transport system permease subunit